LGGAVFKEQWFRYYRELPRLTRILFSYDGAHKKGRENDYSVFTVWALEFLAPEGRRGRPHQPARVPQLRPADRSSARTLQPLGRALLARNLSELNKDRSGFCGGGWGITRHRRARQPPFGSDRRLRPATLLGGVAQERVRKITIHGSWGLHHSLESEGRDPPLFKTGLAALRSPEASTSSSAHKGSHFADLAKEPVPAISHIEGPVKCVVNTQHVTRNARESLFGKTVGPPRRRAE
jgi:hypothetical protein